MASKLPPSRFQILAAEFIEQLGPRLVERVAELVAEHCAAPPPPLDAEGAARYLGVDAATVRRLARAGRIPVIRVADGPRPRLRFDPDELCRALSSPADGTQSDAMASDRRNGSSNSGGAAMVNRKSEGSRP